MSLNRIKLGSVIDKVHIKQENWHESNLIVFGVSNTEGIVITQHKKADNTSSYLVLQPNHFAYNPYRINVGSIGLSNNDCSGLVSPAYVVFKVDETKYLSKFILDFLKSNQGLSEINKYAAGTVRKALRYSDLCNIEIPKLSLIQQKKLYEKVELNKPAFNELINQISLQKDYLAKLKQSILKDAISGKLTEDWRSENPNVEPASELLKRIKAEKLQMIKEGKIRKDKPLEQIKESELPFLIPPTWEWCRLGEICSKTGSGSTPKGGKNAYPSDGVYFLRSQNVYNDGLILDGVAYITDKTHQSMFGTQVKQRDLLLNITGGSIGRCAIVPKEFEEANINQHVAIIRLIDKEMGRLVHSVVISSYFQQMIVNAQTGAGREGLPKNKMDQILIPIPPQNEQKIITEIIKERLEKCSLIEEQIKANEQNAADLLKAVLAEMFEG